jgi:predicted ATP-dependent endonuclease of OLD family
MSIHINTLEVENVKRVQAVTLTPSATGLTVIGGKNGQGKSSVLDAIAWALGGDRYKPANVQRDGANFPPHLKLTLSNGLTVERKGKSGALTVVDPSGKKHGQQLLNSFVETLALDLPKFMNSSDKQKADTLLKIIGVGPQLTELETQYSKLYNERLYTGQEQRRKAAYAQSLPFVEDTPEQEISAAELIREQQSILLRNAENQRKRERLHSLEQEYSAVQEQIDLLTEQLGILREDLDAARSAAADLQDQSTVDLERSIQNIDKINQDVRTNRMKRQAEKEADDLSMQWKKLSVDMDKVLKEKERLLSSDKLPLPGLSVDGGTLLYHGQPWSNMSGAEQLIVSTAIVRRLKPECGFVLLDRLEQLDTDTLKDFGAWLDKEGLQAIATRVSTGDECSIIIEDGMIKEPSLSAPASDAQLLWKSWNGGQF